MNIIKNDFLTINWSLTPYQILALTFASLIFTGTFLLMLPVSSTTGQLTPFVDALFTATSAACVTGLNVVDPGTYYSTFGQMVIIMLIQFGGLGIMTMTTLMTIIMRRKLQLKERLIMQEALNQITISGIARLVQHLVKATLLIEFIGGTILACRFYIDFGPVGIYYGYWHAISAFCNAGFDVIGSNNGNLIPYVGDLTVNLVITSLIILGGLGFIVLTDLTSCRSFSLLRLHSKVVITTTAGLIILGTVAIFLLEYSNPDTMGHLPFSDKIIASYFQAVTVRTAGFATVNIGLMTNASLFLMIVLMFIGASPGSTGGGIKTTTFAVILASVIDQIRGKEDTVLFYRAVPHTMLRRAFTIFFVSLLIVLAVSFMIDINEPTINADAIAFETVSALSTTGLSTGITSSLNDGSKYLLSLAMFLGRVGPVTFAMALVMSSKKGQIHYPEGKISIG